MNRTFSLLALSLAAVGLAYLTTISADAQGPNPIPSVWLQTTSGTTQEGYINISGTAFVGRLGEAYGLLATGDEGVYGISLAFSGTGLHGVAANENGNGKGVHGQSGGMSGTGVLGVATRTGIAGVRYGGFFQCESPNGEGVHGVNLSTTGGAVGGYFISASVDARALYGLATAASGTTYGVVGQSNSLTGGYGVWGTSDPDGWAVYAAGHLGASGTKSFRIDHPFDPENKYLLHYSHEGPEPQNVYNGNITTDANGKAWVQLPDYFAEVNKDHRYQLTVVDDTEGNGFVQVKVARKINGNRFLIMTSAPNIEVSWQVNAKRNDLWVRNHGAPVETEKTTTEKGKFQHPDLYGEPKERGMNYRPAPQGATR